VLDVLQGTVLRPDVWILPPCDPLLAQAAAAAPDAATGATPPPVSPAPALAADGGGETARRINRGRPATAFPEGLLGALVAHVHGNKDTLGTVGGGSAVHAWALVAHVHGCKGALGVVGGGSRQRQ
jgi:hypothetical protein